MFDSVRSAPPIFTGRLGTGAAVSVFFHAGLLAAAVILGARAVSAPPDIDRVVIFPHSPSRGTPNARPAPAAKAAPPKSRPRALELRKVSPVPETPVEIPVEDPPNVGPDQAVEPTGDLVGKVGQPGGNPDAPPSTGDGTGEPGIYELGAGMTPPVLLASRPIQYSRAALEAHAEGLARVRCVITAEGRVEQCRVLQGVAFMNDELVSALSARRYRPVTFDGRRVSVWYDFQIRLSLP